MRSLLNIIFEKNCTENGAKIVFSFALNEDTKLIYRVIGANRFIIMIHSIFHLKMNEQNTSTSSAAQQQVVGEERQRGLSNAEAGSSIFQTPSRYNEENYSASTPFSAFRTNKKEDEQQSSSQGGNDVSAVKAKYTEKTPSTVKSEARTLLKKIDTDDALEAFEQLYTLSLFGKCLSNDLLNYVMNS